MKIPRVVFWFALLATLSPMALAAAPAQVKPASAPLPARHLRIGQSATVQIKACDPDNNTQLFLRRGEVYDFACDNTQRWHDATTAVSPAGDSPVLYRAYLSLFTPWKRCPKSPWFSLIGKVGFCDKGCFKIGSGRTDHHVDQGGVLYCYANDVNGFYFNNTCKVALRVTRRR